MPQKQKAKNTKPTKKAVGRERSNSSITTGRQKGLTESQQLVLVRASQNENGILLLPLSSSAIASSGFPDSGFGSTSNDRRCIEALYRKGLLEGEDDNAYSLKLTAAAFVALNIDEVEWPEQLLKSSATGKKLASGDNLEFGAQRSDKWNASPSTNIFSDPASTVAVEPAPHSLRIGTKGAMVLDLLKSTDGTTIAQIVDATGWQAHSARGFLSGTVRKKLGLKLDTNMSNHGDRTYRIIDHSVGEVK